MPTAEFQIAAHNWHDFYLLTGGAAATLTGLMFLAITFGSGLVSMDSAASPRAFIDPTFGHFLHVLGTACLVVMPTMSERIFGSILIIAMIFRCFTLMWVARHLRRAHKAHGDIETSDWMISIVLPFLAFATIGVAGCCFIAGALPLAFNLTAGGTEAVLAIGLRSAWELMIWMATTMAKKKDS